VTASSSERSFITAGSLVNIGLGSIRSQAILPAMARMLVINPKFDMATQFSEDLAAVEIQGMWGYINKQGKFIINPGFYNAWPFVNDLAPVVLEPNPQFTTPQGTFTEDAGHKWAYIDKTGKIVLKVEGLTDRVGDFIDGIAKIEFRDGRIGYIDQNGKYIWDPK
jgi:hypothetical protein